MILRTILRTYRSPHTFPISPLLRIQFSSKSQSPNSSFTRSSSHGLPDYYSLLGVSRDSSPTEFKEAYYKLAKQLHPDAYAKADERIRQWAERRFSAVGVAYSVLSDPLLKQHYDTFYDLTAIGDRDRMLHWLAIHRPPERLEQKPLDHWEVNNK